MFGIRIAANLYLPFIGAGIRVEKVSSDYSEVTVRMKMNFFNRNYVGTHFGGSLYAMTDPWYMLMLMRRLGPGYIVWDKSANIDFISPGTGTVRITFRISEETLTAIQNEVAVKKKTDWTFDEIIVDETGKTVAKVHKVVYIRRISKANHYLP